MTTKDDELLRELVASARNVGLAGEWELEKAIDRLRRAVESLELKSTLSPDITRADYP